MNETTVVNIRHSRYDVLIDRTTIFGNPYRVRQWGREGCIRRFEAYFWGRIERDPAWKAEVLRLKGKVLGCHCKPLPCHGDVYIAFLATYDGIESLRLQPELTKIMNQLNVLATEEGWYELEVQGEARYLLEQVDNDVARQLVAQSEVEAGFDLVGAILSRLRGSGQ